MQGESLLGIIIWFQKGVGFSKSRQSRLNAKVTAQNGMAANQEEADAGDNFV